MTYSVIRQNLLEDRCFRYESLTITKGIENSEIIVSPGKVAYLYMPSGNNAKLEHEDKKIRLPARSVLKIESGLEYKIHSDSPENLFYFEVDLAYENIIQPDGSQMDSSVSSPFPGTYLFNLKSKKYSGEYNQPSIWFTHRHRQSPLQIGDVKWKKVRASEKSHSHTTLADIFIPLEGTSIIQIGDQKIELQPYELLCIPPSSRDAPVFHYVDKINGGESNWYRHLCIKWPSILDRNETMIGTKL